MRQDYQTVTETHLGKQKDYLLRINQKANIEDMIYECMKKKDILSLLSDENGNYLYSQALKALYQSENYEDLEYHLIMMNQLFYFQSYQDIKRELFQKLTKKSITINEYCVIRHLVDFQHIPFAALIHHMNHDFGVDAEECARLCLLENQYHLAYDYLKKLDNCQDETILNLLCSFSVYDYASLMRHYSKQKRIYHLATMH